MRRVEVMAMRRVNVACWFPVIAVCIFGMAIPCQAASILVDFEDLTVGTTYHVGDVFVSGGVTIEARPFQWDSGTWYSGGYAEVDSLGLSGGIGNDMWVNNINLQFNFGGPASSIKFFYGEYGGNCNIMVNGTHVNFENFSDIDGTTIGGALVQDVPLGGNKGIVSLTGAINSFYIGGQELWIDDVEAEVAGSDDEACCLQDGTCLEVTAPECERLGGVAMGPGTDCATVQCPTCFIGTLR